jgi:hypothetical protein
MQHSAMRGAPLTLPCRRAQPSSRLFQQLDKLLLLSKVRPWQLQRVLTAAPAPALHACAALR